MIPNRRSVEDPHAIFHAIENVRISDVRYSKDPFPCDF